MSSMDVINIMDKTIRKNDVFQTSKRNRVIILLSMRNKYIDTFWFTLFHELAHLLLFHQEGISLNNIPTEVEERVNIIAGNLLIPKERYSSFIDGKDYSMANIREFAKTNRIHPSIIIGRLQYDKMLDFTKFNNLRPKLEMEPQK